MAIGHFCFGKVRKLRRSLKMAGYMYHVCFFLSFLSVMSCHTLNGGEIQKLYIYFCFESVYVHSIVVGII